MIIPNQIFLFKQKDDFTELWFYQITLFWFADNRGITSLPPKWSKLGVPAAHLSNSCVKNSHKTQYGLQTFNRWRHCPFVMAEALWQHNTIPGSQFRNWWFYRMMILPNHFFLSAFGGIDDFTRWWFYRMGTVLKLILETAVCPNGGLTLQF